MSELKPCPLCEADKPFGTVTQEIGIPSGDSGYRLTIKCRDCGCTITRWALKKAWAINSAEAAWNRRTQPNEPLSLEELREMDGEPVWTVPIDGDCGWDIRVDGECCLVDTKDYGCARDNWGREVPFDDYGTEWLAYRRKPEGGEPHAQR